MKIFSTAFADGDTMPRQYTGDGDDISPPLQWSNVPAGSEEFVLMCLDPDTSSEKDRPFVHWLAYGIPNSVSALPEDLPMRGEFTGSLQLSQGINSFGRVGYNGPLPHRGDSPHHYVFRLYALDKKTHLHAEVKKEQVLEAMDRHVIGSDEMTLLYQR